ncbi:MAG: hypothetical protein E6G61_03540 [Actinobacteria bacterium]|nr:MAG: hypothetical protein E6G61_03540 [Actinomycetota bacterium]
MIVMSQHPNVERMRRAYEAFMKGDAEAIRELLADDLVWHVPGRHRFSGDHNKAEVMALFEEIIPEFNEAGDPVVSTFDIDAEISSRRPLGLHTGSLEPPTRDGQTLRSAGRRGSTSSSRSRTR